MTSELLAALAGAVAGALLTGVLTYLQYVWSQGARERAERESQRLTLVREVMRHRLDQAQLIGPLNELPLVFGHDDDVLRLYRKTLDAPDDAARSRSLTDLINRLASLVGLPAGVDLSDIQRGFKYED